VLDETRECVGKFQPSGIILGKYKAQPSSVRQIQSFEVSDFNIKAAAAENQKRDFVLAARGHKTTRTKDIPNRY
jgi:hypothetical protein